MDFNQLMQKMRELDQPAGEQPAIEACGDSMSLPPPMNTPPIAPPSMSVNLNAQGLDNIESMMKLFTKVNPDMMPKVSMPIPAPTMGMIPSMDKVMGPPEMKPINKILPDFDSKNDDMPGIDTDDKAKPLLKSLDLDQDGDHDMDDHDLEKKDKAEAYGNSVDDSSPDYKSVSDVLSSGNDLHKAKGTYPKVAGGDNPMQKTRNESGDLRAQIRAELLHRLAEAKGAK